MYPFKKYFLLILIFNFSFVISQNITISTGTTTNVSNSTSGGVVTYSLTNTSAEGVLNVNTIISQLNAGNSVTVISTRTIAVLTSIASNPSAPVTLSLQSTGTGGSSTTSFSSGLSLSSTGSSLSVEVKMRTGSTSNSSYANFGNLTVTTNGGDFTVSGITSYAAATAAVLLDGASITTGAGNISINGDVNYTSTSANTWAVRVVGATSLSTTTGDINIYGQLRNPSTATSADSRAVLITGTSSIQSTAGGNISITGQVPSGSSTDPAYVLQIQTSGTIASSGTVTIKGNNLGTTSAVKGALISTNISTSGHLQITGTDVEIASSLNTSSGNGNITFSSSNELVLGVGANRTINAGSGNVSILAESPYFNGAASYTTTVSTTGTFTLAPYEVSVDGFDNIATQIEFQGTINGSTFTGTSADIDGLVLTNLSTLSGLTIGAAGGDYTTGSGYHVLFGAGASTFGVNGPLTIYGNIVTVNSGVSSAGAITIDAGEIRLEAGITSTAAGAAILLQATGNILTSNSNTTARTISATNGNLSIIGDSDANGSGQLNLDYTTFSAGTGNVVFRGEKVSWTVGGSATPTITNTTGGFTFESSDASFGQYIETGWFNFPSTLSSFTIGKSTNTEYVGITVNPLSVAGPITLYGGDIDLYDLTVSSATGDIKVLAKGNITDNSSLTYLQLTTQEGDILLAADVDGNGGGYILIDEATGSSTTERPTFISNGGNITLAGGDATGSGFAKGISTYQRGIALSGPKIYSGNGNITIKGESYGYNNGVYFGIANDPDINSGTGTVYIHGKQSTESHTGTNTHALHFAAPNFTSITSANTTRTAITIIGDAIYHRGVFADNDIRISATGSATGGNGGIYISGQRGSNLTFGVGFKDGYILSDSGPIEIEVKNDPNNTSNLGFLYLEGVTLGSIASTPVTETTANVTLTFDVYQSFTSTPTYINTDGTLKVQPYQSSFGSTHYFNGSTRNSLTTDFFPINGNSETLTGLTIGKDGNTADITVANAQTIAGPITVYGGTITLNADLATTNAGDISIYSDNPIAGLGTTRTLTAAGAFKYIPRGTTFSADVTYPITNLTATSTGLTIGKSTNDKNITINADVTGGAGIELYGNNVNINSNLKTTNGANMYLKGNTTIASTKYIESSGNFTHDGNLTFKSDVNGTATFGTLGGTFTKLSGTATVERYIPAKRGWRLLTAPLKGATSATIPANWQGVNDEGLLFFSPATYQSQTMTGYTTGGGMPNIWKYDSANTQWQSIPNLTTENLFTSTGNNGFLVFATGPSNSTNIASGSSETTLRPEGQLITGAVFYSLTADKYHLIGNPYASAIDTEDLVQANANTKVFMVDPTIGTVGGYVTYDGSNWTPTPPSGSEKHIQSGQGFFVRSASNSTFTISESHKVIGNSNTWFERLGSSASTSSNSSTSTSSSVMEDKLRVLLYKQVDSQWQLADGILTVNSATGNNDVDATDTEKMSNFNENIGFRNGTSTLAIEYRGLPTIGTVQPMRLTGTMVQPYQMRVRTENYSNSDLQPYLEDTQTGVLTLIPIDGSEVVVNFTGIAATTTAPDSRFRIVYPVTLSSDDPTASLSVGIYPNPVEDKIFTIVLPNQEEPARYTLTNLLGQQVQGGELDRLQNAVSVASLQAGVYVVQVVQGSRGFSTKIIIK